jgi:hypothetical protein
VAALEAARRAEERRPGERPPFRGPFAFPGLVGPPGVGLVGLLVQKAVQEELKLDDDQVRAVERLAEARRAPGHGFPSPDWIRRAGEDDKAAADLLRPEQAERLRQIVRQLRGPHALGDPAVADALGLSREQRGHIRAVLDDAWRGMWAPPGRPPHRDPEKYWKGVSDRVLAVLTDEQRAAWKGMTGEPFRGELRLGPPPPRRTPGP